MQPGNGQQKRIASALLLAGAVAVTASSALGQSGRTDARTARHAPKLTAPTQLPCTRRHCMLRPKTGVSTVDVVPTQVPAGSAPSFTAPTSNPAQGTLHVQSLKGMLTCDGYTPTDPVAFQFYLGGTFRGDVFYKVTDTVSDASRAKIQFCLGATYPFKTSSGNSAQSVTLPNGLPGFAGLVPSCMKVPRGPCLVSKDPAPDGQGVTLKLLIRAVAGEDPWGRA